VHFKVKKNTKFSKIFDAYCNKKSLAKDQLRFLQDGVRINGDTTPEELDMEDGDCIEAMMQQVGGL
jgi:small ubiquitin-related modifier